MRSFHVIAPVIAWSQTDHMTTTIHWDDITTVRLLYLLTWSLNGIMYIDFAYNVAFPDIGCVTVSLKLNIFKFCSIAKMFSNLVIYQEWVQSFYNWGKVFPGKGIAFMQRFICSIHINIKRKKEEDDLSGHVSISSLYHNIQITSNWGYILWVWGHSTI